MSRQNEAEIPEIHDQEWTAPEAYTMLSFHADIAQLIGRLATIIAISAQVETVSDLVEYAPQSLMLLEDCHLIRHLMGKLDPVLSDICDSQEKPELGPEPF